MPIDTVIIGFAFSAGVMAFLNPCGFAMLPTYVSYFVESNTQNIITVGSGSRAILMKRLIRAGTVGLIVTAAFIATFGLTGVIISSLGIVVAKFLPWIALSSGIVIIGIGVAKAVGKTIRVNIPSMAFFRKNHGDLGYPNFFLFGIGYSIASLSCTLPLFLIVVFQGLSAGGIREGSIVFLTYALGMASIMIAISLAISASNQTFVRYLKKLAPKMNIITSVFLIIAGSYLIYYNLIIGKLLS
jgi:cytochrome c-type biogenesis protein